MKDYDYKLVPAHKKTHSEIKRLARKYGMTMSDFLTCLVEDHKEYVEQNLEKEIPLK